MKPLHTGLRPALHRLAMCLSDRKGSIFVVVGAALPVLIGVLGLGADAGVWYANKRAAQTQTDAAALSGAYEKARINNSNIVPAAQKEAIRNGFTNAAPNTLTILNPPTSGPNTGKQKAVEVIMKTQQQLLFAGLFLDSVAITTRAVATVEVTGSACVLALETLASSTVTNSGSVKINMPGCVLASNSTSQSALDWGGGATVTAESIWTPGNYTATGGATMTLAKPPTVGAWPIDDPYADVPLPVPGPCTTWGGGSTINPGSYCGINITGNLTFNPGTYYIVDADFKVNANVVVNCNCTGGAGVTIIMTGTGDFSKTGTVTFNGSSTFQLTAPTSGPYAGLAFYQDPRAPLSGPIAKFNGGNAMSIQGAVYFPKRAIEWAGNNSPSAPSCTQVIGRTVTFSGGSTINNTGCKDAGVEPISISGVRIVE